MQLLRPGDEPESVAHGTKFTLHAETTARAEGQSLRAMWDGPLHPGSYTVVLDVGDGASADVSLSFGPETARCPGTDAPHVNVFTAGPGDCTFRIGIERDVPDGDGPELELLARPHLAGASAGLVFDAHVPET
ncbi:MAG: hypothetical protein LC624_07665 [Halobacteriales archaeon]|nr:hypothetical protein [Halobacteriales archaeon]